MFHKNFFLLLMCSLGLLGIIIFVNPIGDFPLNDDWQYGYPVKALIEQGKYELTFRFAPNIFLQVIWGYIFCWISGEFSFTYLRYSTIVAAILGGIWFFKLLEKHTDLNKRELILITSLFAFNPIYFSLSFTFMTDVPFLVICLISIHFYLSYLTSQKNTDRLFGALFSIGALFIRQPGILILVGAELSFLLLYMLDINSTRNDSKRVCLKNIIQFLGMLLIAFCCFSFIEDFLKPWLKVEHHYISVGGNYVEFLFNEPLFFLFQIIKRGVVTIFYLGLFSFPLIAIIYEKIKMYKLDQLWLLVLVILLNMVFAYVSYSIGYIFPYTGNIFYNLGVGPVLTKDIHFLHLETGFALPNMLMMSLGLVCQILGSYIVLFLIKKIIKAIKNPSKHRFILLLFGVNMLYLGAMIVFSYFDRYLLLLFASSLLILFREPLSKKVYQYSMIRILTMIIIFFSIVGTKDYLSWNRANKQAFDYLKRDRTITSELVDAGVSINGFERTINNIDSTHQYITSFNQLNQYTITKSFSFYRWLWMEKDYIYTLRKQN